MRRNLAIALGLGALVLVLDQWTKQMVVDVMKPAHRVIEVVPGFFNLIYAENTSAAFGIFHSLPYQLRTLLLTGFAVAVSVGLIVSLVRGRIQRPWTVVATGLIFGGALGNALDRVRYGYVVDFIDWHIAEKFHWNVFNVADSGVVVGVFILLFTSKKEEPAVEAKASAS